MIPLIALTGCLSPQPETEIVVQTDYVEQNIPIQARPPSVEMPPVEWFILTPENLDDKLAEISATTGNEVLFVITPKGYENLAIGLGELRRYLLEQGSIIAYYEEALTDEPEVEEEGSSE